MPSIDVVIRIYERCILYLQTEINHEHIELHNKFLMNIKKKNYQKK